MKFTFKSKERGFYYNSAVMKIYAFIQIYFFQHGWSSAKALKHFCRIKFGLIIWYLRWNVLHNYDQLNPKLFDKENENKSPHCFDEQQLVSTNYRSMEHWKNACYKDMSHWKVLPSISHWLIVSWLLIF